MIMDRSVCLFLPLLPHLAAASMVLDQSEVFFGLGSEAGLVSVLFFSGFFGLIWDLILLI